MIKNIKIILSKYSKETEIETIKELIGTINEEKQKIMQNLHERTDGLWAESVESELHDFLCEHFNGYI